ncbi:hypothetical protein [Phaffia rhodozyma]|uniref:Ser-Thr-rich glycosyl-phosphatidyl-inositol-anchored membrane family n=1 Tax=Phaffia rhodozyma TaxID=264483 RepID=A0A0F7SQU9_PHARH|nr:hypothetical protein [Phaffia rhodozyma]
MYILSVLLSCLLIPASVIGKGVLISHFNINTPSSSSPWVLGATNALTWEFSKTSVLQFDVELVRLSGNGILFVAKNVPINAKKAVIDVQGIPPGDDYYAIFLDSYDGSMYSRSSKFSILANNTASTTVHDATITMTITGSPNPIRLFETTFPALQTLTSSGTDLAGQVGAYVVPGSRHTATTTSSETSYTHTPTPTPTPTSTSSSQDSSEVTSRGVNNGKRAELSYSVVSSAEKTFGNNAVISVLGVLVGGAVGFWNLN